MIKTVDALVQQLGKFVIQAIAEDADAEVDFSNRPTVSGAEKRLNGFYSRAKSIIDNHRHAHSWRGKDA